MILRRALSCFALSSLPFAVAAQQPIQLEMLLQERAAGVSSGTVVTTGDAAIAVAAAGATDPAVTEKLTKWKTLVFDRRPSSVLAAWAAPELEPYDPAEDKEKIDEDLRNAVIAELGVDPTKVEATPAPTDDAAREKVLATKRMERELAALFGRA